MVKLMQGDCLKSMKEIQDGSVDLVLTDPPYGTMKGIEKSKASKDIGYKPHDWDEVINIHDMFAECSRVLRPNGKCVLFGQEPYTSNIITSALPSLPFCYRAVWVKNQAANVLSCNKAMVKLFEDVCVFSKVSPKHDFNGKNPLREYFRDVLRFIGAKSAKEINKKLGHRKAEHCFYVTEGKREVKSKIGSKADHTTRISSSQFALCTEQTYNELIFVFGIDKMQGFKKYSYLLELETRYRNYIINKINQENPSTFNLWQGNKTKSNVLQYPKDKDGFHPTQKPVALLEDLIQTFSNEGNTVLDFTMGSGSTGVACVNTGRRFIGIELDPDYFAIAQKRIQEAENRG